MENLCNDVEFMLNIKVGMYWRWCWGIFTPITMVVILIYSLAIASPLTYGDYVYPDAAYGKCYQQSNSKIIRIAITRVINYLNFFLQGADGFY